MKLLFPQPLNTFKAREQLARDFSALFVPRDFSAYMPNAVMRAGGLPAEGDDLLWTLDSGNDWKLIFLPDEPNAAILRYRYQNLRNPREFVAAAWAAIRLGATLVFEDGSRADGDDLPRLLAKIAQPYAETTPVALPGGEWVIQYVSDGAGVMVTTDSAVAAPSFAEACLKLAREEEINGFCFKGSTPAEAEAFIRLHAQGAVRLTADMTRERARQTDLRQTWAV